MSMSNYSVIDDIEELKELLNKFSIRIRENKYEDDSIDYQLVIVFNDYFAWACSDDVVLCKAISIHELYTKVFNWYDSDGSIIMDKFENVKFPDEGDENDLERYFKENRSLGKELWNNVNKFFDMNNEWIWKD